MAVKLSTFLNTSLLDALDSSGVLALVNDSANITLGTNTNGNYVQSISGGHGISVLNGDAEASSPTVTVDSSVTALLTSTQTFSNKTINLSNNTLSGNIAQFNAALSGSTFSTSNGIETLTNKTITSPTITGPTITGPATVTKMTTFGLRDTNATDYDLRLLATSGVTQNANRTLTFDVQNANREIELSGDIDIGGDLTIANAFTKAGNHATTLTTTGSTSITLPTSGTLVSKDGSGDVTIAGEMTANSFSGDGSALTGITRYETVNFDSDFGDNNTDDLTEGTTNQYFTTTRARQAVSASDLGGYGSFTYDNSTGVFSYTGPSNADIRQRISGSTGISYNASTGVITSDDGNIDHDALSNFVANEHINHTSVSITAGNGLGGGGTIAATRNISVGEGTGITVSSNSVSTNDSEIVHDNLSGFVANEHINHTSVSVTAGAGLTGGGTIAANRTINVASGTGSGIDVNANNIELDSAELNTYYGAAILAAVKANDGAGSGLDADLLDGQQGSSYLRSNTNGTLTGSLTIGNGAANDTLEIKKADNNVADHIKFFNGTTRMGEIGVHDTTWLRINQTTNKNIYTPRYIRADNGFYVDGTTLGITGTGVGKFSTGTTINGQTAWHAGNDGASSGLDADLLDGQHGSYYRINVYNSSGTLLN